MAAQTLKPFRGTHYNPDIISDFSAVVCPPYDVIDAKQLAGLKSKSPYNFCNIILAENNDYRKTGDRFRQWLADRILVDDSTESLYLCEQRFKCQGRAYRRFGFLSLLMMDKQDTIFPHEYTLKEPKEDRKKIIREMEANLSPIFVIVPKAVKAFRQAYKSYARRRPFFTFKDSDGNSSLVWKINDHDQINKICAAVDDCRLVIADGHHRFEVSYDYYKQNKNRFHNANYVLSYIVDAQKGLVILPTHRVVTLGIARRIFWQKLGEYFCLTPVTKAALARKLQRKGVFSFGIYCGGKFFFLKVKNAAVLDKVAGSDIYRKLDTYFLHKFVFSLFPIEGKIEYTHTIEEAKIMAGKEKVAFILRSARLEDVFAIANQGYRLPQKSTYFYPKITSGLVVRRLQKR